MKFWTKEQYLAFSEEVMDKPASFYAFEILYWCGLRVGELLALEPNDIDLGKCLIHVTKSYQRIRRRDVITSPKTPKSKRDVVMPEFLADELADFLGSIPEERRACRIFCFTKSYLHHEMKRGCAACGLEPIRIHDLRHSHVSLLIEMGFSAIAIADRLGHETYEMTLRYAHLFPSKQSDMAAEALMSKPIVDYKGRRRSKTIAFRVSPEEDEVINALVAGSGMTKQDYITSRLECRDINVSPNVRVYRMLRDQMRSVYVELRRLRSADGIDERLIELMQVLTRVFIDLGADELGAVGDDVAQQDAAVLRMARG